MAEAKPLVDLGTCMACRACEIVCPWSCIEMKLTGIDSYRKAYPDLARPDSCTGCGLCATACPVMAITMIPPTAVC